MTVEELKRMSNDKILFDSSKDSLLIRSHIYRYADFLKIEDIDSIEQSSECIVSISIPKGSAMGDHSISVNLQTGIVTADGKVYDEPLPESIKKVISRTTDKPKKASARFTPTINGFSIKDVHTMPSEDGYACYCKVYFNGKKVGDFVDKGDGGEYSFYADPPYSRSKIEEVIRGFPPTNRDYGFEPMEVPYDMNQMVNDLMEMKEIAKELRKLEGSGRDYVLIDDWKNGNHLTCTPPSGTSNADLKIILDKALMMHDISVYDTRRYRNLKDLYVINTFAIEELLK